MKIKIHSTEKTTFVVFWLLNTDQSQFLWKLSFANQKTEILQFSDFWGRIFILFVNKR